MAYFPESNLVSSGNSSTSLLTNGAIFTGTWEDVTNYDSVMVAAKTDQNGYITIEFSPDGSNIDSTLTRYYRTTQIEPPHRFTITRQYVRIKFTNDSGSDQTYLRLQTIYKKNSQNLNIPVDATMSQDYDAISTRPTYMPYEISLGRRQGWTDWNKFGYNEDVDTTTDPEVVAAFGGAFNQKLASGETLSVVSSASADDVGSTGATQIIIYGVDENWDLQTEIVSMDGTTPVVTSGSWLGVNRVAIYSAGTGEVNAGTITLTASSSGNTMATMPVGEGVSQQLIFYIPRNHQFLATWLYLSAIKSTGGGSPEVTFKFWVYSDIAGAKFEVFRDTVDTGVDDHVDIRPPIPFQIGEKSIIWVEAETNADNTSVRGRFSGTLVRDVDA